MKYLLLPIGLLFNAFSFGQIKGPDTVCVNIPVTFTSETEGSTYTWNLDRVNLNIPVSTPNYPFTAAHSGTPLQNINFASYTWDNGNWIALFTNYNSNTVARLDFGNSLDNTPTALSTITGISGTGGRYEGIDVIQDGNDYYAFVINNNNLTRMHFSGSLTATPTITLLTTFPVATVSWPHQLSIKKIGNEYIGFTGDRSGSIVRLDFGTSITNVPTATRLPATNLNSPCNFALHNQNGNWYMLATNLTFGATSGITRLDFGTDIKNNNPTSTHLGNPGNIFSLARGIVMLTDCDNLYAIAVNEGGQLYKLDFNNDITNTPTYTHLGNLAPGGNNSIFVYPSNNQISAFVLTWSNSVIQKIKLSDLPAGSFSSNTSPSFTHTFTAPGIYDLTLFVDQGGVMGASSFCKKVVVMDGFGELLGPDTSMCTGETYTINATTTGATSYTWSTGETSPSINVNAAGTYWVELTGNVCVKQDTITIGTTPLPVVNLGKDTSVCNIPNLQLSSSNQYSNAKYQWSTGDSSPSISVNRTGEYSLLVTEKGCSGKDSIFVTFDTLLVDLGPDTAICLDGNLTLRSSVTYNSPQFYWSTGANRPEIEVNHPGVYTLSVTDDGCTGIDSILIGLTLTAVDLGPDTIVCGASPLTLRSRLIYEDPSYSWNTGDTDSSIEVNQSGEYNLTVIDRGCPGSDSIYVHMPPSFKVNIGEDTILCDKEPLVLRAKSELYHASYQWNTNEQTPSISINNSGLYWLEVTDSSGCTQRDSIQVTYVDLRQELGDDQLLCRETQFELPLTANVPPGSTAVWSTGEREAAIHASDSGIYWVTVSFPPCQGSDTIRITTRQCLCDVYMPNAFTPNNDGNNDLFRPVMDFNCPVKAYNFKVFNRWGQLVYQSVKPGEGWDGTMNGKHADIGTYMYILNYTVELTDEAFMRKGDLILIR